MTDNRLLRPVHAITRPLSCDYPRTLQAGVGAPFGPQLPPPPLQVPAVPQQQLPARGPLVDHDLANPAQPIVPALEQVRPNGGDQSDVEMMENEEAFHEEEEAVRYVSSLFFHI